MRQTRSNIGWWWGGRLRGGGWQWAAALVLGALALVAAGPVAAEPPGAVGWWWRGSRGGIVVPQPAVPEGGLWVANEARDALAVSAVRSGGGAIGTLVLAVEDVVGAAAVVACPSSDWEPAVGGTWEDRPEPDCDVAMVAGVISDDGASMSFDLAGLDLDAVLLVPEAGSAPFSVTFAAPDAAAVVPADSPPTPPTTVAAGPAGSEREASAGSDAAPRPAPPSPPAAPAFTPAPLGDQGLAYVPDPGHRAVPTPAPGAAAAPADAPADDTGGERAPAALALTAGVLGVWGWRSRAAVLAAQHHPLAASLDGGEAASAAAEGLLATADAHGRPAASGTPA